MSDKRRLVGCIIGIGGGFIGINHWSSVRGIKALRIDVDACVPGRQETFEENKAALLEAGLFPENRIYRSVPEMLSAEQGKSDFILIATPNDCHAEQCMAAVQSGFHLICDKPLARSAKEADFIVDAVLRNNKESCVTATYCGHPANIEARRLLHGRKDCLGGRFLYDQAWLHKPVDQMAPEEGRKQAEWRTSAAKSGKGGAAGDILSHLLFQICFITGLRIKAVRAFRRFVAQGRKVAGGETQNTDDQVTVVVLLENGAEITCEATQYAGGHFNDNSWELWYPNQVAYGWNQREPEWLWTTDNEARARMELGRGQFTSPILPATKTMPALHGDGWVDANGRLIASFAWQVLGRFPQGITPFHPTVLDARNVNAVIDAVVQSADSEVSGQTVNVQWRDE